MIKVWISVLLALCVLLSVNASSESSASSSSGSSSSSKSSNDVSSSKASSESEASSESAICTVLRTVLEQAMDSGALDVATLLADASLMSLNNRLTRFRQKVITGDVTNVRFIEWFVARLNRTVEEIFDECDLESDVLATAFDNLLQDLIDGWFH